MNKIIIGISLAVAFLIIVPGVGSLDATQTHDESSISSETEFIPIDNLALSDISNQNSAIFVKSDTVLNTPEKANFFNELLLDGNIIVSESKEAMELIDAEFPFCTVI